MIPPVTDWRMVLACEAWARKRGWRKSHQVGEADAMM